MNIYRSIFLPARLFFILGAIILTTVLAFAFPVLLIVSAAAGVLLATLLVLDAILLFQQRTRIEVSRSMASVLSLGDDNIIHLRIRNFAPFALTLEIIDELPEQFQERDFMIPLILEGGATHEQNYSVRPVSRGIYVFGTNRWRSIHQLSK